MVEQENETENQLSGLLSLHFQNRDKLQELSFSIVKKLLNEKRASDSKAITSGEMSAFFSNYPRTTVCRVCRKLEKLGFIDTRGRGYGYYLSFGFSKQCDKQKNIWNSVMKKATE